MPLLAEVSKIIKSSPRESVKRLITLTATLASGHLPEGDGTHTFRVLSGANNGLWFSTQSPEQSFALGTYEPAVTNLIEKLTTPVSVVYDVGGNTGWDTIDAAQKVTEGHVYTFEPSQGNLPLLKRNIAANGFDNRVTVLEKAVGARSEILTFARYPKCELVNHVVTPENPAAFDALLYQMEIISLDDFVQLGNRLPDLIKIDIEGHEWPAIQGAQQVLDAAKPAVVCEVRTDTWAQIQPFMQRLGYHSRLLGGNGRGLKIGVDDALFTHPSRE